MGVWLLRASSRSILRPSGASTTPPAYVPPAAPRPRPPHPSRTWRPVAAPAGRRSRPRRGHGPKRCDAAGFVGEHGRMPMQFDPPSGTRDFLAADVEVRERAFATIRSEFTSYGFEPLQTPAFERLDVLLGKYGEEGDKLIFKILRRGEHEASGEADLALRYDMTVPLARVAAAYGGQLPMPYKRYAMGPVWRADRPGKGRFREFMQCDIDTIGTPSLLADAEVVCAHHDAMVALGLRDFTIQLNSRQVLFGLLEVFEVP